MRFASMATSYCRVGVLFAHYAIDASTKQALLLEKLDVHVAKPAVVILVMLHILMIWWSGK